jgi:hypothetical protein
LARQELKKARFVRAFFVLAGKMCAGQEAHLYPRHCERSEAIQNPSAARLWIASLRSQ